MFIVFCVACNVFDTGFLLSLFFVFPRRPPPSPPSSHVLLQHAYQFISQTTTYEARLLAGAGSLQGCSSPSSTIIHPQDVYIPRWRSRQNTCCSRYNPLLEEPISFPPPPPPLCLSQFDSYAISWWDQRSFSLARSGSSSSVTLSDWFNCANHSLRFREMHEGDYVLIFVTVATLACAGRQSLLKANLNSQLYKKNIWYENPTF